MTSKSLLRDRLEQRIVARLAYVRTIDPAPVDGIVAAALAARIERNVVAAAEAIIPDKAERLAALDREIVGLNWPLFSGFPIGETVADILAFTHDDTPVWPPRVSWQETGEALMRIGTPESKAMAAPLLAGSWGWGSSGYPHLPTLKKRIRMTPGYPVLLPGEGIPDSRVKESIAEAKKIDEERKALVDRAEKLGAEQLWNPFGIATLLAALAEVRDAAALDTALGCARFAWANVVRLAGDLDALEQITRAALRRSPERLRPMAQDARARAELANELQAHLRLVREVTGLDGPEPRDEGEATALDGGILAVDARLFAALAKVGDEGAALEKLQRPKAEERAARFREDGKGAGLWHLWADHGAVPKGSHAALLLALALWIDVVEPRLRQSPGLVHPVMVDITAAHSRGFAPVTRGGQIVLPLPRGDWQIERLPDGAVAAVDAEAFRAIERGLTLLGGVTAHRLLRWEVFQGHAQWQSGAPNPADLVIDGGWSALAHDLLGMKGQKAVADVRAIVLAQGHFRFTLPGGGRGNLLSYDETPARGGRRGRVKIRLGDALLPGYLFELARTMGDGVAARGARRLVPMVKLPPFVGRVNEHGPQATLSMIFVTELRERARELVEHGGILLDLDAWTTLAERAALPRGGAGNLSRVLARWTHDGDDGPAFLMKVGRDRYTLGPAHAAARDFVGEAGRRETEGSAAGKRSAARRARPRPRRTAKG